VTTPLERQRAATVAVWRADATIRPRGDWADLGGLAVHTTGIAVPYWNGAYLTAPLGLDRLVDAADWFKARDMPWGLLVPSELGLDVPLPYLAHQRVMLRDLTELPDVPELDLRWGHSEDVLRVQEEAFGDDDLAGFLSLKASLPGCAIVTAYDGGAPVATARVICVDGVAGVYGVGTVSSHRRRGLGAAVTLAVLHEGVHRGCDLAFLNPSDEGYGVYAALGFTDAPGWSVYRTLADTVGEAE
jgi:GNAT superfamily N-acetyltransferase